MVLESTIQKNIVKWLNRVPGCRALVYTAHARGNRGHADVYGCVRGRSFFIEVKQEGEEPTPLQAAELRKWAKAGAYVGAATSLAEAKAVLRPLFIELGIEVYAAI